MTYDHIVNTPYGVRLYLRRTYDLKTYAELADGTLFRRAGRVYEKLSDNDCAQLDPWDHDGYIENPNWLACEPLVTVDQVSVRACVYDTDRDGDCQHCHSRGGCLSMGGPYTHHAKYPPGSPDHASAGWQPN